MKLAALPHVSGTFGQNMYGSMLNNAGLGLFFVKEISTRSGGGFVLASGEALINWWGRDDATRKRELVVAPRGRWPGTFAVLQLRRGLVGDFEGLLDRCRALAAEARQDPYLQALEFVDEVPIEGEVLVFRVKEFYENVEQAARLREFTSRHVVYEGLPGSVRSGAVGEAKR